MNSSIALVGDAIENPANAFIMLSVAEMFGVNCLFRDTKRLALEDARFKTIASAEDLATHSTRIACDNHPGARELFGFNGGNNFAAMVGNERRGISHEFTKASTAIVEIPMHSRRVNCLNVAAASAVLMYYLLGPRVGPAAIRNDPNSRRPDLLFLNPRDHFEFGSALRSAAALGWQHAFLEDSYGAWFGCDRTSRSEGRAAARRGKNDIHLVPTKPSTAFKYARATILTSEPGATPLHRSDLTGGRSQLVVLPDPSSAVAADWSRFARDIEFVRLEIPDDQGPPTSQHYRVPVTILLAEITRQIGRRPIEKRPSRLPRRPAYDYAIKFGPRETGELIHFDELIGY